MADTSDGLEFINRGDELLFLKKCLAETQHEPALVVITSPSGFGKSALTDQLSSLDSVSGSPFCIVDPNVRGRTGSVPIYDGFFLQKIAESIDKMAASDRKSGPTLADFLKKRKAKLLAKKKLSDIISEPPSFKNFYKIIYDYIARAFSLGRYSPKKLLVSDDSYAIAICSDYIEHFFQTYILTIIVRETQHIDLHSLKCLLLFSESSSGPNLIMEYTSNSGDFEDFEPGHQKLFARAANQKNNFKLFKLFRLSKGHLEYLIRSYVGKDLNLKADYYLSWSGNLRSIVELKYQVSIGQSSINGTNFSHALADPTNTIVEHISNLRPLEKIILAVTLTHVESIDLSTIKSVIFRINPQESRLSISKTLTSLKEKHHFIKQTAGGLSINNDDVASSLYQSEPMKGLIAVSERALKDHYTEILDERFGATSFFNAVRQYFRLCARTKDVQGLVRSIERLSKDIKSAQDQSIYIDVVSSAIEADPDLYRDDYEDLVNWGAELAYSTGDWQRVTKLLSLKSENTPYSKLMHACALQEVGKHSEALDIVEKFSDCIEQTNVLIGKRLIKAIIIGCQGQYDEARNILNDLVTNEEYSSSPLVGYAYRFFEIVEDSVASIEALKKSIDWFEEHSLEKSKAYSQLALAMLIARLGELSEAQQLLKKASSILSNEVIDQHIILNNTGALELLTDHPDFSDCCELFTRALKFACDDFSELTILINLSLSYLGSGNVEEAERCAEKSLLILENHDFADTNIYWPSCFNISFVLYSVGKIEKSKEVRKIPIEKFDFSIHDLEYWKYRFGVTEKIPKSHHFLCTKNWHPVYLSHWLIDLEGLNFLKVAID